MKFSSSITTVLIAAALGIAAAWWVQEKRYGLRIERIEHSSSQAALAATQAALADTQKFQERFNDALATFQTTTRENQQAAQSMDAVLRDLRGTTASLRGEFQALPQRIASASGAALADYANACTAVFESVARAGAELAEHGATIARAADGHATDARLMRDAWPRK